MATSPIVETVVPAFGTPFLIDSEDQFNPNILYTITNTTDEVTDAIFASVHNNFLGNTFINLILNPDDATMPSANTQQRWGLTALSHTMVLNGDRFQINPRPNATYVVAAYADAGHGGRATIKLWGDRLKQLSQFP